MRLLYIYIYIYIYIYKSDHYIRGSLNKYPDFPMSTFIDSTHMKL